MKEPVEGRGARTGRNGDEPTPKMESGRRAFLAGALRGLAGAGLVFLTGRKVQGALPAPAMRTASGRPTQTVLRLEAGAPTFGSPSRPFGAISSILTVSGGRVVVADRMALDLTLIDRGGAAIHRTGGRGDGPGEFQAPFHLGSGPDGTVHALSQSRSLSSYTVNGNLRHDRTVRLPSNQSLGVMGDLQPPAILENGDFLVGGRTGVLPTMSAFSYTRVLIDGRTGAVSRREQLRGTPSHPPSENMTLTLENGRQISWGVPFGPTVVSAMRSDGMVAVAATDRYRIYVCGLHEPEARVVVDRPDQGAPLDSHDLREAAELERMFREMAERAGSRVAPYSLPSRKPPIFRIWFDQAGRLWVEKWGRGPNGLVQADVYDRDLTPVFSAEWEPEMEPRRGGILDDSGWVVVVGSLGEHAVAPCMLVPAGH